MLQQWKREGGKNERMEGGKEDRRMEGGKNERKSRRMDDCVESQHEFT